MYKQTHRLPLHAMYMAFITSMWVSTTRGDDPSDAINLMTPMEYQETVHEADIPKPPTSPETIPPRGTARIRDVHIEGNATVPKLTILSKSPYRPGSFFDAPRTRGFINNLYQMGLFKNIKVELEVIDPQTVDVYIIVVEKQPIRAIHFAGNSTLSSVALEKKLDLSKISMMDESDFAIIGSNIKKLYAEKDYHNVIVEGKFIPSQQYEGIDVLFTITEGEPTSVRRVFFEGNTIFSAKQLKSKLFTRQEWLFGFLNKAGSFQPDALDYDRHVIETHYHNHGYLTAHVSDVIVTPILETSKVDVTFKIVEGELFTINEVKAPENQILSEEEQLAIIPIRPGQIYSKELIRQTMEMMRLVWGEYGYIDAEVSPSVIPDMQKRTVEITFHTTLNNKLRLNRITLIGNSKTNDNVIRRQILIDEGELITTRKLETSKARIQGLGYFEPKNGVNWQIVRLDDTTADLELLLEEVSTGQGSLNLGFSGIPSDKSSPTDSFRVSGVLQNSNWFGRGIQGSLSAGYSKQDQSVDLVIANPWLFDKPMYGSVNFFHRRSRYDDFHLARTTPSELTTAGFGKLGFTVLQLANVTALGELGFERICFQALQTKPQQDDLLPLLNRKFQSGNVVSIGAALMQDLRNHPTHPTGGIYWNTSLKVGIPYGDAFAALRLCESNGTDFGFVKLNIDGQWYASLIEEYSLVFRLRGFAGFVQEIGKHAIPYRELYHIGGQATVRGFNFGQISPILDDSSVGAKKAFVVNAELLFPITASASIRGVLFYDGGAGWDTPDKGLIPDGRLHNNRFNYRHAIGFGVRLTQPTPLSIDIGFKLDRNKRLGETLSEVAFNMTRDF
jgi:outer membrane protein insertion porin family